MYDSQITKDRINELCKNHGVSVKKMLSEIGLNPNAVGQISNERGMTSVNIIQIADYLHTSVDYLLGRTDNPDDFSSELKEISQILSQLSTRKRIEFMNCVYGFIDDPHNYV